MFVDSVEKLYDRLSQKIKELYIDSPQPSVRFEVFAMSNVIRSALDSSHDISVLDLFMEMLLSDLENYLKNKPKEMK